MIFTIFSIAAGKREEDLSFDVIQYYLNYWQRIAGCLSFDLPAIRGACVYNISKETFPADLTYYSITSNISLPNSGNILPIILRNYAASEEVHFLHYVFSPLACKFGRRINGTTRYLVHAELIMTTIDTAQNSTGHDLEPQEWGTYKEVTYHDAVVRVNEDHKFGFEIEHLSWGAGARQRYADENLQNYIPFWKLQPINEDHPRESGFAMKHPLYDGGSCTVDPAGTIYTDEFRE